jgi:hypothetical protein
MPLGLFLFFAFLRPALGRRNAEARDRMTARGDAHFRIAPEIADQNDFVHAAHRSTLPFLVSPTF